MTNYGDGGGGNCDKLLGWGVIVTNYWNGGLIVTNYENGG